LSRHGLGYILATFLQAHLATLIADSQPQFSTPAHTTNIHSYTQFIIFREPVCNTCDQLWSSM
jgi:hypothetical protein